MFDEITQPMIRVRARRWYTIPLSILSHSIALFAVIVIPLMATGELRAPSIPIEYVTIVSPPPPSAPPPIPPDAAPPPIVPPCDCAPSEAPSGLSPEPPPILRSVVRDLRDDLGETAARSLSAPPPAPAVAPAEPVPVGGKIRAPTKISGPSPVFPTIARAARMSGVVFLEAVLDKEGRVKDVRVVRPAGVFDQPAIDAVSQWRYTPTMLNGEAVEVKMNVTVVFNLN
jgi:periplasmic protein TonB